MKKRALALLLAVMLIVSMLAACGSNTDSSSAPAANNDSSASNSSEPADEPAEEPTGEIETIVYAIPLTKTVDMGPIEDELNKITEPKIGVHVKIEGIQMANFTTQLGLMMSGEEPLDCFGFLGAYSSLLANNQLAPLNDLIDQYGQGIKEAVGEEFLKATTSAGTLYAIPCLNGKAAVLNIVLRDDLIQELDLPVDQLTQAKDFDEFCKNLDLITEMYAKIHEAHPEYACVVPGSTNPNTLSFDSSIPFVDGLNDNLGVLMPNDNYETVQNMYATEEFKTLCEYAYKWNQAGYVLEDATTTQESTNTYLQNNRTAGYYIIGEEGQAEQITTATGIPVQSIKILSPFIVTSSVNGIDFAIAPASQHKEAAMKFLNETYTNPDVVNLLDWGIEGVHYEVQDDGTVDFPEGVDATNTTYGLNMDWFFGNQFLGYIWGKGRDTTIYERLAANNRNSQFTPVMGFSYDSTKVSTELAAISNVTNQYLPGLTCGSLDPETELPKFLAALDDAGAQKVIEEKARQLEEWKAANQ